MPRWTIPPGHLLTRYPNRYPNPLTSRRELRAVYPLQSASWYAAATRSQSEAFAGSDRLVRTITIVSALALLVPAALGVALAHAITADTDLAGGVLTRRLQQTATEMNEHADRLAQAHWGSTACDRPRPPSGRRRQKAGMGVLASGPALA